MFLHNTLRNTSLESGDGQGQNRKIVSEHVAQTSDFPSKGRWNTGVGVRWVKWRSLVAMLCQERSWDCDGG